MQDQVRAEPLPDQFPGKALPKNLLIVGTPASCATCATFIAGSMPRAGISGHEFLQKVAVVAGNLDNLAILIELVRAADFLNVSLRVRHPVSEKDEK